MYLILLLYLNLTNFQLVKKKAMIHVELAILHSLMGPLAYLLDLSTLIQL